VKQAYSGQDWRLHPAAAPLHELYAHGDMAMIHCVRIEERHPQSLRCPGHDGTRH